MCLLSVNMHVMATIWLTSRKAQYKGPVTLFIKIYLRIMENLQKLLYKSVNFVIRVP